MVLHDFLLLSFLKARKGRLEVLHNSDSRQFQEKGGFLEWIFFEGFYSKKYV